MPMYVLETKLVVVSETSLDAEQHQMIDIFCAQSNQVAGWRRVSLLLKCFQLSLSKQTGKMVCVTIFLVQNKQMDSPKVLHTTCNIDVRHAVMQFFIIVDLSSRGRWPRRREESAHATIINYYFSFVRCERFACGSPVWPREKLATFLIEEIPIEVEGLMNSKMAFQNFTQSEVNQLKQLLYSGHQSRSLDHRPPQPHQPFYNGPRQMNNNPKSVFNRLSNAGDGWRHCPSNPMVCRNCPGMTNHTTDYCQRNRKQKRICCDICGCTTHATANCRSPCANCGLTGHKSRACPKPQRQNGPICTCKHCPLCGNDKQRSDSSSPTPHKKIQPEFSYNNENTEGKRGSIYRGPDTTRSWYRCPGCKRNLDKGLNVFEELFYAGMKVANAWTRYQRRLPTTPRAHGGRGYAKLSRKNYVFDKKARRMVPFIGWDKTPDPIYGNY
uniref:CCHC-type domain-containing protein n=1 Tax=Romanomermis culicivorax TaxID=13658 RepID=A0A915IJJ6_ROMCU